MRSKRIYSVEHDTVCHACGGKGYISTVDAIPHFTQDSVFPEYVHVPTTETCDECHGLGVIQRPAEQERF